MFSRSHRREFVEDWHVDCSAPPAQFFDSTGIAGDTLKRTGETGRAGHTSPGRGGV
jgi:hypothetical protein